MKKLSAFVFISLLTAAYLQADVIRLKNGKLYIGKIISLDARGAEIEAYGERMTVPYAELYRTEKDMRDLKNQAMAITLKDKTVIQGKILNYDDDVGFLIQIDFGTITVPLANVAGIVDTGLDRNYVAHFTQIGVYGGAYFPVGDLGGTYDANFSCTVFQEINLGFLVEGLFAGLNLSYYNISCATSESYSYLFFNAGASLIYRLVFLRREASFLRNFVPFAGVGAGAALPVMTYFGSTTSEIDLSLTSCVGLDVFLNDNFIIRINGRWLAVAQRTIWLNTIGVNVGAAYSF